MGQASQARNALKSRILMFKALKQEPLFYGNFSFEACRLIGGRVVFVWPLGSKRDTAISWPSKQRDNAKHGVKRLAHGSARLRRIALGTPAVVTKPVQCQAQKLIKVTATRMRLCA